MTIPDGASGESGPSLADVQAAIGQAIPESVVTWPAPYDRRYGQLDDQDRLLIVQNAAARVMALLGGDAPQVTPPTTRPRDEPQAEHPGESVQVIIDEYVALAREAGTILRAFYDDVTPCVHSLKSGYRCALCGRVRALLIECAAVVEPDYFGDEIGEVTP